MRGAGVIGQHNRRVAADEHALQRTRDVYLAGGLRKGELCGRERHTVDDRLVVVVVKHHRCHVVGGLNMQFSIGGLIGLHLNRHVVVAKQRLVAVFLHLEGVLARLQTAEYEHAVVERIHLIGLHDLAVFQQVDLGAIDRLPLVIGSGSIVIEAVGHLLVQVLHGTHDVACGLRFESKIGANAACHAHALLTAPVLVERPVARRLVGMEVALEQETRCGMLQYA